MEADVDLLQLHAPSKIQSPSSRRNSQPLIRSGPLLLSRPARRRALKLLLALLTLLLTLYLLGLCPQSLLPQLANFEFWRHFCSSLQAPAAGPFPNIRSTHSLVAKHVTEAKWKKLGGIATKTSGFTLAKVSFHMSLMYPTEYFSDFRKKYCRFLNSIKFRFRSFDW